MHTRLRSSRPAMVALAICWLLLAATLAPWEPSAAGGSPRSPVVEWIDRHARPVRTEVGGSLGDLSSVPGVVRGATVVGLGESTHGSSEQFRVKHRLVRLLVERLGFRTVAFEDDFASGVLIDRYVVTGEGDPRQLVTSMSLPFWAVEEVVDLLEWMRAYNLTHADPVRFLGTDLTQLRELSFDAVTEHVREVAPDQLDELESAFAFLSPREDQFSWYRELSDAQQEALIGTAREASDLVQALPPGGDALEREYAEQHARAIVGWYVNYAEEEGFRGEREVFMADSIRWWQGLTGHKVAFWAANVHTASTAELTVRNPWAAQTGPMAGSHLEDRLGRRYVSVGTHFHDGAISSDYGMPAAHRIGPPGPDLLESTLGASASPAYLLRLGRGRPGAVRAWLDGPATMRMILPSYVEGHDADAYNMTVPSLRQAFDALVFVRTTTPTALLPR